MRSSRSNRLLNIARSSCGGSIAKILSLTPRAVGQYSHQPIIAQADVVRSGQTGDGAGTSRRPLRFRLLADFSALLPPSRSLVANKFSLLW